MLILDPASVSFGESTWTEVRFIAVDRSASRVVLDRSDSGPYAVFADAVERSVTIQVAQQLNEHDQEALRCGDLAELVFFTAPAAGSARRQRIRAVAVVVSIEYELSAQKSVSRRVRLVALSPDGHSDPVAVEPAE